MMLYIIFFFVFCLQYASYGDSSSILEKNLLKIGSKIEDGLEDVVSKLDPGERFQEIFDCNGVAHKVDMYLKENDLIEINLYDPDKEIKYYLFTRETPTLNKSEILINKDEESVNESHFDKSRSTALLIHGWRNNITSDFFQVLVPAYLEAEDCNLIAVDWSVAADTLNYIAAVFNTVRSGEAVSRFVTWLNDVTGADLSQYHVVGHSLGGQMAGIVGRNLNSSVPYITGLDPAQPGWLLSTDSFKSTDGLYTEVIHSNAGGLGYLIPVAHQDFYPNGGTKMPGCGIDISCSHSSSYKYFGESLKTDDFIGRKCRSFDDVLFNKCTENETLVMGGIYPKYGEQGIYSLKTSSESPYAEGVNGIEDI